MNKLIYIILFVLLCVGCTSSKKEDIKISVQNFQESFTTKDELQFLNQFPKNFEQFHNYFGWNSSKDKPQELYEVSNNYITYWFYLLNNPKYKEQEKNIVNICINGKWEADGVNYFRDKSISYIKEKQKYYLINDLNKEEAISVLIFLFDAPHPVPDADFVTNLNAEKQQIVKNLFKNKDTDKQKDDIDFYSNNDSYFVKDIDINNDTVVDKVVSHRQYQGDELLLFVKTNDRYELVLKTINFSEDGGNQIIDIKTSETGFVVVTAFLDRGFLESHFYISLIDDKWMLTNTIYKTEFSNKEDSFIYVCEVKQGIDISNSDSLDKVKFMPEESSRDRTCLKRQWPILATIDSVSIGEIKHYMEKALPTIFAYYSHEKVDEVEIWSDKMFGRCCTEADLSYSELLEFDITAIPDNSKYPYRNLTDKTYRTAFVFKKNQNTEITLKLKRNEETHKYHTELLVDEVLQSSDTLLKPFRLSLVNGYVKSEKTFKDNGRVQEIEVFLNNKYKGTIQLQDTPLIQEFELDFVFSKDDVVKLIPMSYYNGAIYDDICISEIQSSLAQITHPSINKKYQLPKLLKKGRALNKVKK